MNFGFFIGKNMLNSFYGIKLGQTQTFTENGERIPVTEIFCEPLTVVQVKNTDNDGYVALKVAFGERKAKNINKSVKGELNRIDEYTNRGIEKKTENKSGETVKQKDSETVKNDKQWESGTMLPKYFREIRVKNNKDIENIKPGDKISIADIFKSGDILNVSGTTIGKGFQGGVKRWGFHGGPRTHGQADRERAPGSIGQTTTPGRVYKGKHMAGRMGGSQATVENLQFVGFNSEKNIAQVKGLVPGKKRGVLKLYK